MEKIKFKEGQFMDLYYLYQMQMNGFMNFHGMVQIQNQKEELFQILKNFKSYKQFQIKCFFFFQFEFKFKFFDNFVFILLFELI